MLILARPLSWGGGDFNPGQPAHASANQLILRDFGALRCWHPLARASEVSPEG